MKAKIATLAISALMMISLISVFQAGAASAQETTIDGVLSPGEWGEPLCTTVGYTHGILTVTVYAHATTDALYLAFDTGDVTDGRDEAGLDVLDWNVGLVGSDMTVPWRYALRTKISADTSWGDSWSVIGGYSGCWEDTWKPNPSQPTDKQPYWEIPDGLEMVTSFGTGHRVTEFKVPMSLMFDGEHGWNDPPGGETLLLGGCFTGEDSGGTYDQLWWPTGIDHGTEETYAPIEVAPSAEQLEIDRLNKVIEQKDAEITELNDEIAGLQGRIAELETVDIINLEKHIDALKAEISTLNAQISRLEASGISNASTISALRRECNELEKDLKYWKNRPRSTRVIVTEGIGDEGGQVVFAVTLGIVGIAAMLCVKSFTGPRKSKKG